MVGRRGGVTTETDDGGIRMQDLCYEMIDD